jgi:hypothetical protein
MSMLRLCAFLLLFLQCTKEESPRPWAADLYVYFVGNSLTYENNLPSLVAEIAKMDGVQLSVTTTAKANYSFDDHWADGSIQATLRSYHYDFLVGQQGPSALPESQVLLRESSIKIAEECRAFKTTLSLYMVWPSLARDFDRDNCIASYTNAAKASNAQLSPAGLAWKLAWQQDPELPLYGPDNFHPSIHGSVLAAMVIYASINEKDDLEFIDKSKASWGENISDEQFTVMKNAAINAVQVK